MGQNDQLPRKVLSNQGYPKKLPYSPSSLLCVLGTMSELFSTTDSLAAKHIPHLELAAISIRATAAEILRRLTPPTRTLPNAEDPACGSGI
jgi:hypothetical protein